MESFCPHILQNFCRRLYRVGVLVILVASFSGLTPAPTLAISPILELVVKIQATEDSDKRLKLSEELEKLTPGSAQDAEVLLGLITDTTGELQQKAINTIARIEDPKLGAFFIPKLGSPEPMVQAVAAGMSGKLKLREAVPGLINILKQARPIEGFADTPPERATVTAALALGEIGDERGIPVLLGKLGQMISYEAKALGKFGAKVLPKVLELITTGDTPKVRKAAAAVLMYLKDPEAGGLLRQEVQNPSSPVRRYALAGLLKLEGEQALPEIIQLWEKDKDPLLESYILSHINTHRLSNDFLCSFLVLVLKESPASKHRKGAAVALARVGGAEARAALEKAAEHDEDSQVRVYATQALEMLSLQSPPTD